MVKTLSIQNGVIFVRPMLNTCVDWCSVYKYPLPAFTRVFFAVPVPVPGFISVPADRYLLALRNSSRTLTYRALFWKNTMNNTLLLLNHVGTLIFIES